MEKNVAKKSVAVADLKVGGGGMVLSCPSCHETFSADKSDYFQMGPRDVLKCMNCGTNLQLKKASRPKPTALDDGWAEDDYVVSVIDRDGGIGLFRVQRGGWRNTDPLTVGYKLDQISDVAERDARARGVQDALVWDGDEGRQIGHVLHGRWQVDESGRYDRNGRGIYYGTAAGKNDMVLHQDHRGRWRIDLVTSASGNHTDVTGRAYASGPNSGYGSPEAAFQDALDVQHKRSIRGKSHVYIADRDGNLSDYEPEQIEPCPECGKIAHDAWCTYEDDLEPNGRATVADPVAARELDLYIANTHELVGAPNSIGKNIDANLKRKLANGTYDSALAPKAWQHLVDEGAKRYEREFGSDSPIFNAATRRQVAADFARAWEDENKLAPNGSRKPTIVFVYAGPVERWVPSKRSYEWRDGYSEGGNTQPWLTRREAQESASARGARAEFRDSRPFRP